MQPRRLHKVEYSNRIRKDHCSEIGRGAVTDCSNELLKEPAKTAGHVDNFKALQRLQDLQGLVISMRWR